MAESRDHRRKKGTKPIKVSGKPTKHKEKNFSIKPTNRYLPELKEVSEDMGADLIAGDIDEVAADKERALAIRASADKELHSLDNAIVRPMLITPMAQATINDPPENVQQAFAQSLNRQTTGDGLARLCQADGDDDGGGNVTVDNASGWSGYANSDVNGARHLTVNELIQFRTSGGSVHDAGLLITAITPGAFPSTSAILALSGTSTSIADGDYAYIALSTTASNDNYSHEMPGVKGLIDDASINTSTQGINSDTYPEWRSQVGYGASPGTAEALTSLRMNEMATQIEVVSHGDTSFMAASPGVWNTYANLEDQNNTIMNAGTFDAKWPALNFNGKNLFRDPYLADEIYYIDSSTIAFYQPGSPGWIDMGGGSQNQTLDKDQLFATYRHYLTMGITNRAKNGKLTDITVISKTKI